MSDRMVGFEKAYSDSLTEIRELRAELAAKDKRIEELERTIPIDHPHPWYGPCDGFAEGGECKECEEVRKHCLEHEEVRLGHEFSDVEHFALVSDNKVLDLEMVLCDGDEEVWRMPATFRRDGDTLTFSGEFCGPVKGVRFSGARVEANGREMFFWSGGRLKIIEPGDRLDIAYRFSDFTGE